MYFYLKEPKSSDETLIVLQYYIKGEKRIFKYSTQEKIKPIDWNFAQRAPVNKRGAGGVKLKNISLVLNQYSGFLEEVLSNIKLSNKSLTRELLKKEFDLKFRKKKPQIGSPYFTDFIVDFTNKAHLIINRSTKRNNTPNKIKHYKRTGNRLVEFENDRKKKIRIDSFDLDLYDEFVQYCLKNKKYSINNTGDLIKNIKVLLKKAKDSGFEIHKDIGLSEFSVMKEDTISVSLDENEINKIFAHNFKDDPKLSNCRDIAIIGLWTGLRVSDFLTLPEIDPSNKFIEVKPKKTELTSGKKVIIPLHFQIREMIKERGMPRMISDVKFNVYIKEVCKEVGIDTLVKGSLMDPILKRKRTDYYPKYKLVSSHTCRRSFATNLYKMNFPTLSIMNITGHTTEKNFLKYIKVTPKEHAEKLLDHWNEYYGQ